MHQNRYTFDQKQHPIRFELTKMCELNITYDNQDVIGGSDATDWVLGRLKSEKEILGYALQKHSCEITVLTHG